MYSTRRSQMDVSEVAQTIRESLSVKRVFGEPVERDGTTVIPVAKIRGGGGGGGGGNASTGDSGSGAGFAVGAKPCGAYVIRDGVVRWEPALDLNRVIAGRQVLGLLGLLILRNLLKRRTKRK
jgi:uncharacterized spore protein YtfJ